MPFTITHETTTNTLCSWTRLELVTAINAARPHETPARLVEVKINLLARAEAIRNDLKTQHEQLQKDKAAQWLVQFKLDNQHPRFRNAVGRMVNKLHVLAAAAEEKVAAAMVDLQKDVRRNLSWKFETLALESNKAAYFTEAANKIEDYAQDKTIAEVQTMLSNMQEYWMDRVLSRGFSHSTNTASNMCDEQEFEVIRLMVKLFMKINELFTDDLARGADEPYRCDYVGWCL